jgi:hypothetical protein
MMETPKFAVEIAAEGIEILAVAIILAGLGLGTVRFLLHSIFNRSGYELQPVQGNSRQSSTLGLERPRGGRYRADSRSRAYYHKHHRLGPAGFGPHLPELVAVRRTGSALALATRTTSNRRARQLMLPLVRDAIERVHRQPHDRLLARLPFLPE